MRLQKLKLDKIFCKLIFFPGFEEIAEFVGSWITG